MSILSSILDSNDESYNSFSNNPDVRTWHTWYTNDSPGMWQKVTYLDVATLFGTDHQVSDLINKNVFIFTDFWIFSKSLYRMHLIYSKCLKKFQPYRIPKTLEDYEKQFNRLRNHVNHLWHKELEYNPSSFFWAVMLTNSENKYEYMNNLRLKYWSTNQGIICLSQAKIVIDKCNGIFNELKESIVNLSNKEIDLIAKELSAFNTQESRTCIEELKSIIDSDFYKYYQLSEEEMMKIVSDEKFNSEALIVTPIGSLHFLHIAIHLGYLNVVKHLIEQKNVPYNLMVQKENTTVSPFWIAVRSNKIEIVKYLLNYCNNDLDRLIPDQDYEPFAKEIIFTNKLEILKILINISDKFKKLCQIRLHLAALNGSVEMGNYLVEGVQASISFQNDKILKSSSLRNAILYGETAFLKFLVDKCGVDPEKVIEFPPHETYEGLTPLTQAILCGSFEIIKYLIEIKKVDPQQEQTEGKYAGYTPLLFAIDLGQIEIVQYLIEEANVNFVEPVRIYDGITPLHYALRETRFNIFAYLVEKKKVDCNILNFQGETPLYYATKKNLFIFIIYLIKYLNIDPTIPMGHNPMAKLSKEGFTPAWCASLYGNPEILGLFFQEFRFKLQHILQTGIFKGDSLLDPAARHGQLNVLKYLKKIFPQEFSELSPRAAIIATKNCQLETVKFFTEECNINPFKSFNKNTSSLFLHAVHHSKIEIVRYFTQNSASYNLIYFSTGEDLKTLLVYLSKMEEGDLKRELLNFVNKLKTPNLEITGISLNSLIELLKKPSPKKNINEMLDSEQIKTDLSQIDQDQFINLLEALENQFKITKANKNPRLEEFVSSLLPLFVNKLNHSMDPKLIDRTVERIVDMIPVQTMQIKGFLLQNITPNQALIKLLIIVGTQRQKGRWNISYEIICDWRTKILKSEEGTRETWTELLNLFKEFDIDAPIRKTNKGKGKLKKRKTQKKQSNVQNRNENWHDSFKAKIQGGLIDPESERKLVESGKNQFIDKLNEINIQQLKYLETKINKFQSNISKAESQMREQECIVEATNTQFGQLASYINRLHSEKEKLNTKKTQIENEFDKNLSDRSIPLSHQKLIDLIQTSSENLTTNFIDFLNQQKNSYKEIKIEFAIKLRALNNEISRLNNEISLSKEKKRMLDVPFPINSVHNLGNNYIDRVSQIWTEGRKAIEDGRSTQEINKIQAQMNAELKNCESQYYDNIEKTLATRIYDSTASTRKTAKKIEKMEKKLRFHEEETARLKNELEETKRELAALRNASTFHPTLPASVELSKGIVVELLKQQNHNFIQLLKLIDQEGSILRSVQDLVLALSFVGYRNTVLIGSSHVKYSHDDGSYVTIANHGNESKPEEVQSVLNAIYSQLSKKQ